MNLEKLNTWLTFVGHIAILLGLIALAVEIRHNTSAVRAQELGDLQNQEQERRVLMLSTDLPRTYLKSLKSPSELNLEEIYIVNAYMSYRLDQLRRYYRAYQDGIINKEDWESEAFNVPIYLDTPIGRLVWGHLKKDYSKESRFVAAVEAALANGVVVPDDIYYRDLQNSISGMTDKPHKLSDSND